MVIQVAAIADNIGEHLMNQLVMHRLVQVQKALE